MRGEQRFRFEVGEEWGSGVCVVSLWKCLWGMVWLGRGGGVQLWKYPRNVSVHVEPPPPQGCGGRAVDWTPVTESGSRPKVKATERTASAHNILSHVHSQAQTHLPIHSNTQADPLVCELTLTDMRICDAMFSYWLLTNGRGICSVAVRVRYEL